MNVLMFYEIMKQKSSHEMTLVLSLSLMSKYTSNIELLQDDKFNPFYRVKVSDLIKQDISDQTLMQLNIGGWELSEDKEYLVNFIV